MQGDTAEAVYLAQINSNPLGIGALTGPAAIHIAVGDRLLAAACALATRGGDRFAQRNVVAGHDNRATLHFKRPKGIAPVRAALLTVHTHVTTSAVHAQRINTSGAVGH